MNKLWVVFFAMFFYTSQALSFSLSDHEKGWYWHDDPKPILRKKEKVVRKKEAAAAPDKTWKLIGHTVEVAMARAILDPTPENVAIARKMQRKLTKQASIFSERWTLDLLLNPEQDESLVNPNSSAARGLYNQENSIVKDLAVQALSKSSGFIYFYEGGEAYSEKMAEVLKDFGNQYQIGIIPISVNNHISFVFPKSLVDSGQAQMMHVKHIPAIFSIHPKTNRPMPIAYGVVSHSELKDNILMASEFFSTRDYIHE
ncbi:MAG: type-F conjugative transfer system pilin assembly protein TraF [Gammaproteobacteria bacterium]|nr:type-F conjugative transfer system pilin assembly protein TraF [Gammaproteobacteria bacterium]